MEPGSEGNPMVSSGTGRQSTSGSAGDAELAVVLRRLRGIIIELSDRRPDGRDGEAWLEFDRALTSLFGVIRSLEEMGQVPESTVACRPLSVQPRPARGHFPPMGGRDGYRCAAPR